MSDQMAADHRRDHDAQRLMDDARRAIDMLLSTDTAARKLSTEDSSALLDARSVLVKASRSVTAIWD